MTLTKLFDEFFNSEKSGGVLLISCTALSLLLTNSAWGSEYIAIWNFEITGHSLTHWINDGLMAIFFLMIGLELEREIYIGEFSDIKNSLLPVIAAFGGMILPASLHLLFNLNTKT